MSKFESSPLNLQFKKCKESYLDLNTDRVIAGVSGGPDSMALLYLLHRHNVDTVVVHCNYQLRGSSSDQDQTLVEEICALWGIECVSVRLDYGNSEGGNFQEWARNERYRIFHEIRIEYEADYILTAHHEDDQIETILQRMLRGSGFASWKGMSLLDGCLMRPLLSVTRSEIMAFVQDYNIPYRIDRTNEESTYARNFIRNHWFPDLNRLFPGWKSNLLLLSDRADEYRLLTDRLYEQLLDEPGRLSRKLFIQLDDLLKPVILHRFIQDSNLDADVSKSFLTNLEVLQSLQTGKGIQVTNSLFLTRDRDHYILTETGSSKEPIIELSEKNLDKGLTLDGLEFILDYQFRGIEESCLQLDAQKLQFPLVLRPWSAGDQLQPLGLGGTQNVADLLTNRKVSAASKKMAKVIESFDETVYAVIFPDNFENGHFGMISDLVRCDEKTTKTLTIRKI